VAPVENFLRYVNNTDFAGNYDNSAFHRLDKGFVLQGGGFKFNDAGTTTAAAFPAITDFPPVVNEPGISNTRGTIAMAKLGGNPNSATNEFFFNLADNGGAPPNGLDFQNGGFTVFGELTASGQAVVDDIEATFQEFNSPNLPGAPPFPLRPGAVTPNFPANISAADLALIFRAVTLTDARGLTFSVPTSTTPTVATAAIANNTLTLNALTAGTTTISFTATSADGLSTTVSFNVTVS
jgi:cyclophilin family peptidyl-prolyl cis-trans isomerase